MNYFLKTSILVCAFFIYALAAYAQTNKSDDQKVFLTNEATINSEHLEYSPAFYEDGIVFISSNTASKRYKILDSRINENIMSIFRAVRQDDGLLQPPVAFARELLTPVHEGPLTFDRTNENIYFTRNNYSKGKGKKAKDGIVKLKVYSASYQGGKWTNIKDLSFNDDNSNTAHPSISVDGDKMYFASDRPGGFGGMDIYVSTKQGDSWGDPVNLGPEINTEVEDIFPYIHADGTFYFASKGHSGYGGLDIFYSSPIEEGWTKPVNLGKPFNSQNDDFGFIIDRDKKNGYISSNRSGGLGQDDIFSFYITTNLDDVTDNKASEMNSRNIDILVIDYDTGDPVPEASVRFMNLDDMTLARAITSVTTDNNRLTSEDTNELLLRLSMEDNSKETLTDFNGLYPLKGVNTNYIINVKKEGYQPRLVVLTADSDLKEILVSLKKGSAEDLASADSDNKDNTGSNKDAQADNNSSGSTTPTAEDYLVSSVIKEGTTFELPNIYYNFNDASIRPDARLDLDALTAFLKQYPDIEIELASHTDSRGRSRYNRRLSRKRAQNAVKYLVSQGVDRNRLKPIGYGETQVRNHCVDGVNCREYEHQYNRRTEVKITKISREINVAVVDSDQGISSGGSGDFRVVAGVFENYSNAESRLSQLRDSGFDTARIVSFGGSKRHSVIVNRFSSLNEARALVRNLKEYSIRSFIKR